MNPSLRSLACLGLVAVGSAPLAAELRPAFEALPAETVVALRIDYRDHVMAEYRSQTRAGDLFFGEDGVTAFHQLVERLLSETEAGPKIKEGLDEIGLEAKDVISALGGTYGLAWIQQPVADGVPMPTVLVWVEGEEATISKLHDTIIRSLEEDDAFTRVDSPAVGTEIMRFLRPEEGDSFLLARLENRIHFAVGLPVAGAINDEADGLRHEEAEFELLGRFLQASREGLSDGFLQRMYAAPALAAERPTYPLNLEVLGDIRPFLAMIPATKMPGASLIPTLGLDGFTEFAIWGGFAGTRAHFDAVLGLPAPRRGLGTLFEADPFPFSPPASIPSTLDSYAEMAFDLPRLYAIGKTVAAQFMDPMLIEQQLQMADAQAQGMLGAGIEDILQAFGRRLHFLQYPTQIVDLNLEEEGVDTPAQLPIALQAFFIDFNRPDLLDSAMALSGAFTNDPNSPIKNVDELGFRGIRVEMGFMSQVWAYGLGKLAFAQGPDGGSRFLAALSSPPEGELALVNDPTFRTALRQEAPRPGILFQYQDGARAMENLNVIFGWLKDSSENADPEIPEANPFAAFTDWVDPIEAYLPAPEVLAELLVYSFSHGYLTEHGLVLKSVSQMK